MLLLSLRINPQFSIFTHFTTDYGYALMINNMAQLTYENLGHIDSRGVDHVKMDS